MPDPGAETQAMQPGGLLTDELLANVTLTHALVPDAGGDVVPDPVDPAIPPTSAADPATPPEQPPAAIPPDAHAAPERPTIGDAGLDLLFRTARTSWAWTDAPVDDATIRAVYDLAKWGPTSANCSPARFMVLRSKEAKDRLRWTLSEGNAERALAALAPAPAIVIVAQDPRFYDDLPRLYPQADARTWFANNEDLATATAFRNATLQGAYFIIAARALGLDCAPMSGFDNARVDSEFFLATGWKSNFLLALGHADLAAAPPRNPRLSFDEACRLL